jgi:transposase-like protein
MSTMSRKRNADEFKARIIEYADHHRPVSELAKEFDVK